MKQVLIMPFQKLSKQQFKDHGGAGEYVDLTKESDGEISGISLSDGEEGMDAETVEILKRKQEEGPFFIRISQ